jgi:hypothetical protein
MQKDLHGQVALGLASCSVHSLGHSRFVPRCPAGPWACCGHTKHSASCCLAEVYSSCITGGVSSIGMGPVLWGQAGVCSGGMVGGHGSGLGLTQLAQVHEGAPQHADL